MITCAVAPTDAWAVATWPEQSDWIESLLRILLRSTPERKHTEGEPVVDKPAADLSEWSQENNANATWSGYLWSSLQDKASGKLEDGRCHWAGYINCCNEPLHGLYKVSIRMGKTILAWFVERTPFTERGMRSTLTPCFWRFRQMRPDTDCRVAACSRRIARFSMSGAFRKRTRKSRSWTLCYFIFEQAHTFRMEYQVLKR